MVAALGARASLGPIRSSFARTSITTVDTPPLGRRLRAPWNHLLHWRFQAS
jgi:hypothetical protein